ncbi:hypothetical protein [Globicatella sanguinis]|uniref:hypothetical protein n=1 Tax=Globicatella sanguinis TaxID=13076 RepID=UPI0012EE186A|nr:hypothetical protein [Globicatella sanguinis]
MKKYIKYTALTIIAIGVATKVVLNKKDKLKVTFKDGKLVYSNFDHKNLKINLHDYV